MAYGPFNQILFLWSPNEESCCCFILFHACSVHEERCDDLLGDFLLIVRHLAGTKVWNELPTYLNNNNSNKNSQSLLWKLTYWLLLQFLNTTFKS